MQSKLTLRLEDELIKSAKLYASSSGKSVSRIVADFFFIIQQEKLVDDDLSLTPIVQSLRGSLRDSDVSEEDYQAYLEEKHL